MYGIARIGRAPNETAQRLALAVSQGGEFAFVLFAACRWSRRIRAATAQLLIVVRDGFDAISPPAFALQDRLPRSVARAPAAPEFDTIAGPGNPVIIAGYGRVGQILSRVPAHVRHPVHRAGSEYQQVVSSGVRQQGVLRRTRRDSSCSRAAKTGEARLFVLAIDDVEASDQDGRGRARALSNVPILARARNRVHLFRLRDLGVEYLARDLPASLEMARQALLSLGFDAAASDRAMTLFRRHDERQIDAQYAVQHTRGQLSSRPRRPPSSLRSSSKRTAAASGRIPEPRPPRRGMRRNNGDEKIVILISGRGKIHEMGDSCRGATGADRLGRQQSRRCRRSEIRGARRNSHSSRRRAASLRRARRSESALVGNAVRSHSPDSSRSPAVMARSRRDFVRRYSGRMHSNIHPSLLPRFPACTRTAARSRKA